MEVARTLLEDIAQYLVGPSVESIGLALGGMTCERETEDVEELDLRQPTA